jgi:hypothetical protein
MSVSVEVPLVAKAPLAPVEGAVNVTATPLSGLLSASVTVATSGFVNCVLTFVLWPLPLVAVMMAGAPAEFDKLKLAGVAAPVAAAVTE